MARKTPSDKELTSYTRFLLNMEQFAWAVRLFGKEISGKEVGDILKKSKHKDAKKVIRMFEQEVF